MDRQQILLAKALEAAEIPLDVATFHTRLILQKAVYLLQSAGVQLGYRFRWYLRGPYSPDMTAGAFGIIGEGSSAQEELRGWKLDAESKAVIDRLKPLLCEGDDKAAQASRLELLASVLFLINTKQAKENDAAETSTILRRYNKNYHAEDVRKAIQELKTYGLL